MKTYKAEKPLTMATGVVRLTEDQARRRKSSISKIGDDEFRITSPFQFKAGEVFGYDGELPKSMAVSVMDEVAQEATPEAPKKAVKAGRVKH